MVAETNLTLTLRTGHLLPRHRHFPRPRQVQHTEWLQQFDEFFHLAFVAGDLDGQALGLHVHDFGAENVRDLHHLGPRPGIHGNLYEHQFAVHVFAFVKILHFDRVGQLLELLDDLLDRRVIAARDDGHARSGRVLGGRDVERINVVTAPAEQARHAREHAELVFHEHRNRVSHKGPGFAGRRKLTTAKIRVNSQIRSLARDGRASYTLTNQAAQPGP